jgi:hypothetical protein
LSVFPSGRLQQLNLLPLLLKLGGELLIQVF